MPTSKKTASTLKSSVAPVVRFSIGANEVRVADEWRVAGDAEISAAVEFYRVLFGSKEEGGHGGDIAALLPFKDGAKRSNEQAAFFDFAQRMYLILKCGADLAAVLLDRNVDGKTEVQRPGLKSNGSPYKPQPKRALKDTLLGSKDWGVFVRRMVEIKDSADLQARIDAGEIKEGEAVKGAKSSGKSDREYAIAKAGELIKRMSKDAEKQDGSIAPDVMHKFAAYLADGLKTYGLK